MSRLPAPTTSTSPRAKSSLIPKTSGTVASPHARRAKAAYTHRPIGAGKDWDTTPEAIQAATPAGYTPARNEGTWLAAVKNHPAVIRLYACRRAKLMRLVQAVVNLHQRATSTLCITRQALIEATGLTKTFINENLRFLRENQLISVIASGRSATYAPKGQPRENLAPVYLLLTPAPPAPTPTGQGPVDETRTPSSFSLSLKSLKRDWKKLSPTQRYQRVYANRAKDPKTLYWPMNNPTPAPGTLPHTEYRHITARVALTIQRECLDTRAMSRDVLAKMITPYLNQGWTIKDLLTAFERRSDGTPWTTRGAGGMRSIRAWVRTRLNAWLTPAGEPVTAPSIIAEQARVALRAEQSAERARTAQARAKAAPTHSPNRLRVRRLAAITRCGSEAAARHQHPELFERA